jgi:type 1 glutamine amidotransferase
MIRRQWLLAVGLCALAATALAAPTQKALIVTGQNGHDWKGTTPVLQKILEDTGMFTVDVATSPAKGQDMSGFHPKFADYKLVVLNYQGDEWPEATKKDFVNFVEHGGGVVVYHFACASFPNWKEYNEIIGLGGWGGRTEKWGPYMRWVDGRIVRQQKSGPTGSHGPMQPFQIVVRESDHPITKGLPEKFMHADDELYGWLRGPGKNLTVLATAFAPAGKLGGADEHEPVLFTVQYGKGRVFFNALGHTPKELKDVSFIFTFQRGAQWAATGKVTQKVPDDFPTADKASVRK